ncbi:PREDICTED: uncharacterized protein LOC101314195 [Fragaria vesca subsp. vesca]|uniref:uncharacterized protein LOC101314195 n=1 Tax=Fragaria vesca subsp. vesca TaxID=101020 RepID=UPI0002C363AA|nr:PREDICTED: uncharacterized protein LOC101314195 [Fragaria vesca subsp. vesca]XP_011467541.1 PREDICTED: uncharacterized protein LOC101314195 [Fragaria vesca subsp. vesca]
MARSLSQTLTLTRHLSPKTSSSSSSRFITLRAQSNLPFHHDQTEPSPADSSPAVDPLLRKLEDAIHRIIVRKSAPDWLPFAPGASYWVPPPRSRSHGLAQLVEKLANPLTEEESMSMTTVRGWPSSAYFIHGSTPLMEAFVPESSNVEQRLDSADHKSDAAPKSEEEEG